MSENNKFRFFSLFGANYQAINDGIQSAVDEAKSILDSIQRSLETEPEFIKVRSDFDNCNISEEKKTILPNEEFEIYKYYHEKTADRDCNFYFGFFYGPHLNNCAVKEIIVPRIYFVTGLWILHNQQMDKYVIKNKNMLQRNTNGNYYYLNPEPVPVAGDLDIEVYKSQALSAFKEAMAFLNFLEKS